MTHLTRWWFAPAPAERLAALRMVIGGYALLYVVVRWWEFLAVSKLPPAQFEPAGLVRVLDAPLPPGAMTVLLVATAALLALMVAGWHYRIVAPLAALALLWITSYRNSWGMVFHTENLMVLHVIALACAPAADAWAVDLRRKPAQAPLAGYGWPIKLMIALTAATYVIAGIAKIRIAGSGWEDGLPYITWIDGELLRNQVAIDNLRKALLGDGIAPLASTFLDHPAGFTVFCVMTLAIELGAFAMLLGGRIGRAIAGGWVLGAWAFHVGVVLLMNIWFPYALFGFAFAPVFHLERPFSWLIGRWGIRRDRRRTR